MSRAAEKMKEHIAGCEQCKKALHIGGMCQTGKILSRVIDNREWLEKAEV